MVQSEVWPSIDGHACSGASCPGHQITIGIHQILLWVYSHPDIRDVVPGLKLISQLCYLSSFMHSLLQATYLVV